MVILKVQLLYTFAHAFDEEAVLCIDKHAGGRDGVDELVELVDVTDSNSFTLLSAVRPSSVHTSSEPSMRGDPSFAG